MNRGALFAPPADGWTAPAGVPPMLRGAWETPAGCFPLPANGRAFVTGEERLFLWRRWGPGPAIAIVGVNPSTAAALKPDNTIRSTIRLATAAGFQAVWMLNLWPYCATSQRDLFTALDDQLPMRIADADRYLRVAVEHAGRVALAWGRSSGAPRSFDRHRRVRAGVVIAMCQQLARPPHVWGITEGGHPAHPLYMATETPLVSWNAAYSYAGGVA